MADGPLSPYKSSMEPPWSSLVFTDKIWILWICLSVNIFQCPQQQPQLQNLIWANLKQNEAPFSKIQPFQHIKRWHFEKAKIWGVILIKRYVFFSNFPHVSHGNKKIRLFLIKYQQQRAAVHVVTGREIKQVCFASECARDCASKRLAGPQCWVW